MKLDELKKKFIVDENTLKKRLESVVSKAMKHCVADTKGGIHIENRKLPAKDKVMLVLSARAIASELDSRISSRVTLVELAHSTGLPQNQVSARCNDLVKEKLAQSPKRGLYQAIFYKVEIFLDSLPDPRK